MRRAASRAFQPAQALSVARASARRDLERDVRRVMEACIYNNCICMELESSIMCKDNARLDALAGASHGMLDSHPEAVAGMIAG